MAKGTRGRRGISSRQVRPSPYPLPSHKEEEQTVFSNSKLTKKDYEDATCSVCMECPHNAVLLLCSSYEKGCRPYMCGTSFRYSNCLDQYKNAYTKTASSQTELACPLCRGQVKGWTVVGPARAHLNSTKRTCTQDNCSFVGTFKELRKHVKADHPCARPREVDPTLEQKWRRMEHEREREDVMSTIRSSIPGAVFFGDYVIEGRRHGLDSDDDDDEEEEEEIDERMGVDRNLMSVFLFLQAFGSTGNTGPNRPNRGAMRLHRDGSMDGLDRFANLDSSDDDDDDGDGNNNNNNGTSLAGRLRRQGRVVLGHSGRRA